MSTSAALAEQNSETSSASVSEQTRSLARRLAGHMGLKAAIQISSENQWHGVVAALLEMQRKQQNDS